MNKIISFLFFFLIFGTSSLSNKITVKTNYKSVTKLIDINTAPKDELKELRGIGAKKADKIIKSRTFKKFKNKEELLERKLIGETTYKNIKEVIKVDSGTQ